MPFTFSHPAAILPLVYLRRYVCLTGFVAGSLTPDFEYFLMMQAKSDISHTMTGIFLFCLPVGILLGFIFHNIIRDSLIDNLPLFLKARFSRIKQFNWNRHFVGRWYITAESVAAGAWSHIFWDSFTHDQYSMYQHPSTALGAVVILAMILKMPRDKEVAGKIDMRYWLSFLFLTVFILLICFLCGLRFEFEHIGRVIISGVSACLLSITAVSWVWKFWASGR